MRANRPVRRDGSWIHERLPRPRNGRSQQSAQARPTGRSQGRASRWGAVRSFGPARAIANAYRRRPEKSVDFILAPYRRPDAVEPELAIRRYGARAKSTDFSQPAFSALNPRAAIQSRESPGATCRAVHIERCCRGPVAGEANDPVGGDERGGTNRPVTDEVERDLTGRSRRSPASQTRTRKSRWILSWLRIADFDSGPTCEALKAQAYFGNW